MNRPVHFEIHAPDPEAAIAFYEKALGWKFPSAASAGSPTPPIRAATSSA
jgi:predicted enzyme related to lactoylglutathione lyase